MTATASTPRPCACPRPAALLHDAARSALGRDVLSGNFAPVLPTRWPAAGGGVAYWMYRFEPLPTGAVRDKVRGPTNQITFATLSSPPDVRRLGPGKVLGDEGWRDGPDDEESRLHQAEQALVEVVAGCRALDSARPDLQFYIDWIRSNPLIGKDLETRAPAFFAWLKAKSSAGMMPP